MDALSFVTVMLPVVGWNFVSHHKRSTKIQDVWEECLGLTEIKWQEFETML